MDPMTIMAGASALSGLMGASRGGGTKVTQNNQQTQNTTTNNANNTNIAFNPVLAAMTGGGVAPATSGDVAGGLTQTPTTTSSPVNTMSDPSSVLPRSSPTGYSYGPGFGYTAPIASRATGGLFGDDLVLLLLIGVGLWFATQEM